MSRAEVFLLDINEEMFRDAIAIHGEDPRFAAKRF
jgi:hypothetical protein